MTRAGQAKRAIFRALTTVPQALAGAAGHGASIQRQPRSSRAPGVATDVRKAWRTALGCAAATTAGLFALQAWYASYLDVAVIHESLRDAPMDEKLAAVRSEEQAELTSGPMPIERAMKAIARQGKSAFPALAAKPSEDLSAMSGWIHRPGFQPYVPRRTAAPKADATPPPGGSEGAGDSASEERHAQ